MAETNGKDYGSGDEVDTGHVPRGSLSKPGSRRQSLNLSRSVRASSTRFSDSLSRSVGYGLFGGSNPLEGQSMGSSREDDENALKWAALEKLPTYNRLRTSVFEKDTGSIRHMDVKDMSTQDFNHLLQKLYRPTDAEDEQLLAKVRKRLDRLDSS